MMKAAFGWVIMVRGVHEDMCSFLCFLHCGGLLHNHGVSGVLPHCEL